MMARSDPLHPRAGYRSARPTTAVLKIQLATRGRSSARPMQYKGCFPAVNAEVAKSDIFATCNSLKSQGRPRLIVPISKLRATTLKLWPGHQPIIQEFRHPDRCGSARGRSLRQSRLSQSVGVSGEIFRAKPRHSILEIGNAQLGIELKCTCNPPSRIVQTPGGGVACGGDSDRA
jgi:hypothetical protein